MRQQQPGCWLVPFAVIGTVLWLLGLTVLVRWLITL